MANNVNIALDPSENPSDTASELRALIVEDDQDFLDILKKYIEAWRPAFKIDHATDGGTAWKLIKEKKYDLIVLDWRLPVLNGMIIFNRLRTLKEYEITPVIVSSGLLDAADLKLFKEYPCTSAISKPYTNSIFIEIADALLKEHQWYLDNWMKLDSAIALLHDNPSDGVQQILKFLAKNKGSFPATIKAAKALSQVKEWKTAQQILVSILKNDPNNVVALYELGKVLYSIRDFASASKTLAKAQSLSPKNISRAHLMGEVALNAGDPNAAEQHFQQAATLDPKDPKAQAGIELSREMKTHASEEGGLVHKSLASILNLTGVSLIKQGKFDQAIVKYQRSLEFLADSLDKGRVLFNLGLAFKRSGKMQEATETFKLADKTANGLLPKVKMYLENAPPDTRLEEDLSTLSEPPAVDEIPQEPAPPPPIVVEKFQVPMPTDPFDILEIDAGIEDLERTRSDENDLLAKSTTEYGKMRVLVFHPDTQLIEQFESQIAPLKLGAVKKYTDRNVFLSALQYNQPGMGVLWIDEKSKDDVLKIVESILDCCDREVYSPLMVYTENMAVKNFVMSSSPPLAIEVCKITEWKRNAFAKDFSAAGDLSAASPLLQIVKARYQLMTGATRELPEFSESDMGRIKREPALSYRFDCLQCEYLIKMQQMKEAETLAEQIKQAHAGGIWINRIWGEIQFIKGNLTAIVDAGTELAAQNKLTTGNARSLGDRLREIGSVDALEPFFKAWVEVWKLSLDSQFYALAADYFSGKQENESALKCIAYSLKQGLVLPESVHLFRALTAKPTV